MSTQQPPGGPQPEGDPGYAQPQDPWEGGYEPGLASVPTDPIPQQYDPYPHGQGYGQSDVWSRPTVAQGGPQGYQPQPPKPNRAGIIVLIVLIVLVLGGGGGFAAWYFTTQRSVIANPSNSATPAPSETASATPTGPVPFDPYAVGVDDCIANNGTEEDPDVHIVGCSTDDSYRVIKIVTGVDLVEGPGGKFDRDTTSVAACEGTKYKFWYGYQDPVDDAKDVFYCMVGA